jgi:hypothetical protein
VCRAVAMLMAAVAAHVWLVRAPETHGDTARSPAAATSAPAAAPESVQPSIRLDIRTIVVRPASTFTLREARMDEAPVRPADLPDRRAPADTTVVNAAMVNGGATAEPEESGEDAAPVQTSAAREPERVAPGGGDRGVRDLAPLPAVAERVTAAVVPPPPAHDPAPKPRPAAVEPSRTAIATAADARTQQILDVLARYAHAYERMDVKAAKALYPSLDDRALRRAFHDLDGQQVRLANCGVSFSGQDANARCQSSATYRPKVGSRVIRLTEREWTFNLSLDDAGWQIVDARMQ